MPTYSLNSKKCLILEATRILALSASLALSLPLHSLTAQAAPQRNSYESGLYQDILKRDSVNFEEILKRWQTEYGTKAVAPLLQIAQDRKVADQDRYVALMGAAKLGGSATSPKLAAFLKDSSWMIRSAALQALTAIESSEESSSASGSKADQILALLEDPSLIVRAQAVDAILKLRPLQTRGAASALLRALEDPANYHHGKAQWVPQKALHALIKLNAKESVPRITSLLGRSTDQKLVEQMLETLEALTGKKPGAQLASDVPGKIRFWQSQASAH